jgi:hypothetical protein
LTFTNGFPRRDDPAATARATSSFPVPLSPWIKIGTSVPATLPIRFFSSAIVPDAEQHQMLRLRVHFVPQARRLTLDQPLCPARWRAPLQDLAGERARSQHLTHPVSSLRRRSSPPLPARRRQLARPCLSSGIVPGLRGPPASRHRGRRASAARFDTDAARRRRSSIKTARYMSDASQAFRASGSWGSRLTITRSAGLITTSQYCTRRARTAVLSCTARSGGGRASERSSAGFGVFA